MTTITDKKAAAKQRAKERAKAAKAAYLARPDVQVRLAEQKAKRKAMDKARRQKIAAARKNKRKSEKSALTEAKSLTRQKRQSQRDAELSSSLTKASAISTNGTSVKPQLTVITGGLGQNK